MSILPECITVPSLREMVPCAASVWATMALPSLTHQPAPGWLRTEADGHQLAEALPSLAVQRLVRGQCPVASLLRMRISAPRPTPSVSAGPPGSRFSRLSPFGPTTTQRVRPFLPARESTRDPKSVLFPTPERRNRRSTWGASTPGTSCSPTGLAGVPRLQGCFLGLFPQLVTVRHETCPPWTKMRIAHW